MDKCRLCLKCSKNLKSIFTKDENLKYADMVNLIANVKISKDDGITDKICLTCRRKVRDLYDFKLLIERSHVALQNTCNLKKINFNDIDDIKFSIDIKPNDCKESIPLVIRKNLLKNYKEPYKYNDIVIQKISIDKKEPLSVIDFLKSIKAEPENDCGDDYVYETDVDYDPDLKHDPDFGVQPAKRKVNMKKKKIKTNSLENMKPIKPVYLNDLKLVPAKPKPKPRPPNNKEKHGNKLHICPYCGKMIRTMKQHLLSHTGEKKFKCDKCAAAFHTLKTLTIHTTRVHGPKTVKCDYCVATFTGKGSLKIHMKRHTGERRHVCDICNKAFMMKGHVLRHKRALHNLGAKPVKCELCPNTFNSVYGLRHHMRVHTGERPYRCEICSQPYSYKHDFNRHCFKKHGVFFKRRSVYVMNEEVLIKERALMKELMLRVNGIIKDDKGINPFEGPQAALAFEQTIKAIESGKIKVDFQF